MTTQKIPSRNTPTRGWRRGHVPALAAAWIMCLLTNAAGGQDDRPAAAPPDDAPARQLIDRLFSQRGELLSGKYTAKGRKTQRLTPDQPEEAGDVFVYCAFDYVRGLLCWEREEPRRFRDPDAPATIRQSGYRYIKTPDKSYHLDLLPGVDTFDIVGIRPPDLAPKHLGVPYDVRTFGLMGWTAVSEDPWMLERTKDWFSKLEGIDSKERGGGEVELSCTVAPDVQQTWRIDTAHGDTVTSSHLDVFERAKNLRHEAIEKTQVVWEERNSVWVPVTLLLERRFNGVETYNIELQWESVNEELSADEFEPEALHVRPGSRLADGRGPGKSIIVGNIEGREAEPRPDAAPSVPGLGGSTRLYWILAITTIVILLVFGVWHWRAKMNSTT